ncbi:cyclin-P4-1-like [Oryza glaberrima]|uniref:Cyclin n=1 Tax=Oryza glaberrima TaxID=4538 RepID=I1NWT3_ORYGL|nr:cyclin-P4-1-like [Oryza glaberrima]
MERTTTRRTSSKGAAAAPAPKVVAVLAGLLERAAARGDADADARAGSAAAAAARAFRGRTRPEISVRRYAERIYRYAGCSPACFVVARVYLDRLAGRSPEEESSPSPSPPATAAAAVCVDSYSVHRLLITSVMVAAKFMDDIHYNNAYFARVGGVEVAEMNGLELELLFALRFRLNVTPATFATYCAALEGEMAADDGPLPSPSPSPEEEGNDRRQPPPRRKDGITNKVAAAVDRSALLTAAHHRVVVVEITQ